MLEQFSRPLSDDPTSRETVMPDRVGTPTSASTSTVPHRGASAIAIPVLLWIAYLVVEVGASINHYTSVVRTPQQTSLFVHALVFDLFIFVILLIMVGRFYNWARIVLAVLGGLRLYTGVSTVLFLLLNRATLVLLLNRGTLGAVIPFLLPVLLAAAMVAMFMPTANRWFASRGRALHDVHPTITGTAQPDSAGLFCSQCGRPIRENSNFCAYCGTNVS